MTRRSSSPIVVCVPRDRPRATGGCRFRWRPLRSEAFGCGRGRYPRLREERGFESFLTQSPAAAFSGRGASAVKDAAKVDAGLRLDLTDRIGVYGFFEGEFAGRGQSTAGFGGLDGQSAGPASASAYGGRVGMNVKW